MTRQPSGVTTGPGADAAWSRDRTVNQPPAMLQRMAQLLGLSSRLGLPEA